MTSGIKALLTKTAYLTTLNIKIILAQCYPATNSLPLIGKNKTMRAQFVSCP